MSPFHIQSIAAALAGQGWDIQAQAGDDYAISEIWALSKVRFSGVVLHLVFEGMDEHTVLPLEKAYACYV